MRFHNALNIHLLGFRHSPTGTRRRANAKRQVVEQLQARTLLSGDTLPTTGNNLGFERATLDGWGTSTDESSGAFDVEDTITPGPVTISAIEPTYFGRAYVRASARPPAGEFHFARLARTIELYAGERLQFSWFGFAGNGRQSGSKDNVQAYIRKGTTSVDPIIATDKEGTGSAMTDIVPGQPGHFFYLPANGYTEWRTKEFTADEHAEYRLGVIARKARHRNYDHRVQVGIDDVRIYDNDTDAPTAHFDHVYDSSGNRKALADHSDRELNRVDWNISDGSGISAREVRLQEFIGGGWQDVPDFLNDQNDISFWFLDSLGLGTFRLYAHATDDDGARGDADRTSGTYYSNAFTIFDDDTHGPTSPVISPVGGKVSDTNEFLIRAADAGTGNSGVSRIEAMLYKDDSLITPSPIVWDGELATGSGEYTAVFNVDSYVDNHGCGTYRVEARALDNDNDWSGDQSWSAYGSTTHQILDCNLPKVEEPIKINGVDAAQRSMVQFVNVPFNQVVDLQWNAIVVRDSDGAQVPIEVEEEVVDGKTIAIVSYANDALSFPDGRYELTVIGSLVTNQDGQHLDGENTGCSVADYVDEFFRLFGDFDGNAEVNFDDYNAFHPTYRSENTDERYVLFFDYDGDGNIDAADLWAFRQRFLQSV